MAKKQKNKIARYPVFLHVNVGMVFFAFMLIYVVICVFTYFSKKHIVGYEVKEGSLSSKRSAFVKSP